MKKWHYFLVALFAVFCSCAIVLGSSMTSYVGAKRFAGAYMSYDVNESDDSPYWEQYTMPEFHDYDYIVGADGSVYSFYVDSVFHDEDDPESDEDDYYEYVLYVDVYDGTNVTNHVVDNDELDLEFFEGDLSGLLNLNNIYIYEDDIYIGSALEFDTYFVFDTIDFTINSNVVNRVYFMTNFATFYFTTNGDDRLYLNGTEIVISDISFDDSAVYAFVSGDYFYLTGFNTDLEEEVNYRFNSDGTYVVLDDFYSTYSVGYFWSDGKYAYYDNGTTHMIFDTATNEWVSHTWSGYTGSFNAANVWSDGEDVYLTFTNGITYRLHIDRPYVSPYPNVLSELIALMTGGIAGFASGIGENLSVLAESIFVDATTGGLSAFGGLVVIFAGIALALGLSRWVVNFITSFGRRDR